MVYHWLVETALPSIENMGYFHKICYQNKGNPKFIPAPDSALDPWGALDKGWPDKIKDQWPAKEEVAACKAKAANKTQVAHSQNDAEK